MNSPNPKPPHSILVLQLIGLVIIIGLGFIINRDLSEEKTPNESTDAVIPRNPAENDQAAKLIEESRAVPPEKIFNHIYKTSYWGNNQAGQGHSGFGSTVDATLIYRTFLQDFLKVNNIQSVVDAGCGDWEFSQAIDWTGIDYKGFDIVEDVIKANIEKHSAPNVSFAVANIVKDPLPKADLLIVKHVLQHIPNAEVHQFLPQIHKYKHVLLINSVDPKTLSGNNKDTTVGGYRHLDLTRPPFNLRGNKVLAYTDELNAHLALHLFQNER